MVNKRRCNDFLCASLSHWEERGTYTEMTGSYSPRCGAMKLSTGKVVTKGKEVKEV